jgi:hypothetical protein
MDAKEKKRVRGVIMQDMKQPLEWWWLSFGGQTGWLGGAIIHAGGLVEAASTAARLGCNPGGEVLGVPIPEHMVPDAEWRERLLSLDEVESINWEAWV